MLRKKWMMSLNKETLVQKRMGKKILGRLARDLLSVDISDSSSLIGKHQKV
jgi:hypothetical protein